MTFDQDGIEMNDPRGRGVLTPWRVALSLLLLLALTLPLQSAVAAPRELLPDLGMIRLRDFKIQEINGQRRLRFTTIIVNIGEGPFQVLGHSRLPNDMLQVDQQIVDAGGHWKRRDTEYRMFFAGDGHNHWHLRNLEHYVLKKVSNSQQRTGAKHGFCFFDNYEWDLDLPGAPQERHYLGRGCGDIEDPQVTTGLSVGWGDRYSRALPTQYIGITGLPNGKYTLTATADWLDDFRELCEGNNKTVALIRINGTQVTVLDAGDDAQPC